MNAPLPSPLLYPHPDAPTIGRVIEVASGVFWRAAHLNWNQCVVEMKDFASFFARHGMPDALTSAQRERGNIYKIGVPTLPRQYRRILAGESIRISQRDWRVIVGLGHAPEHASFYCGSLGVLIAGDMLLPKISTNVSVGPQDPDGDPLALFLSSIGVYTRLSEDTLVLPSHGLPFIGIRARVDALNEHHRARLSELHAAASETDSVTAYDLLPVLFRRSLDTQQQFFAMGESIAHLNHLWRQQRLSRSIGRESVIRFSSLHAEE